MIEHFLNTDLVIRVMRFGIWIGSILTVFLNVYYYILAKDAVWRNIKLAYAFNGAVMSIIYALVLFDGPVPKWIPTGAILLLVTNIVAGSYVGLVRHFYKSKQWKP